MTHQVAIVGAGPSGLYAAEYLLRQGCRVDLLDRLPTPYGLLRYGVAPDHQSTKAVSRVMARTLAHAGLRYFGGVCVGRDLSLAELRQYYYAVVVATGAGGDRRLDIPGESLDGVYGSRRFVDWYNLHPERLSREIDLSSVTDAVIIGNGNVALDVARMLAKTAAEFAGSDLSLSEARTLTGSPLRTIYIVGRRGADAAGFSPAELDEIGRLERAVVVVDPADLGDRADYRDGLVYDSLSRYAAADADSIKARGELEQDGVTIRFRFGLRPQRMTGEGRVEAVEFADAAERVHRIPAQLVVSCIGYRCVDALQLDEVGGRIGNDEGRVQQGVYVVGWAKRGPSGVIAVNRADSHQVAKRLLAECTPDDARRGREGLMALLAERAVQWTDHAAWLRIDAHERATAEPERVRRKLRSMDEMLEAASATDAAVDSAG